MGLVRVLNQVHMQRAALLSCIRRRHADATGTELRASRQLGPKNSHGKPRLVSIPGRKRDMSDLAYDLGMVEPGLSSGRTTSMQLHVDGDRSS